MKTSPSSRYVRVTIDLLPEFIELLDQRLAELFCDDPKKLQYINVQLDLRDLAVQTSAHIDAYYDRVLQCRQHIARTSKTTGLSPASVYNYNNEHRKSHRNIRFSKI